eukprot:s131_g5.t1
MQEKSVRIKVFNLRLREESQQMTQMLACLFLPSDLMHPNPVDFLTSRFAVRPSAGSELLVFCPSPPFCNMKHTGQRSGGATAKNRKPWVVMMVDYYLEE